MTAHSVWREINLFPLRLLYVIFLLSTSYFRKIFLSSFVQHNQSPDDAPHERCVQFRQKHPLPLVSYWLLPGTETTLSTAEESRRKQS